MIFRAQKRVPAEELTEVLLRKFPVWEFCNDDEAGETHVRPVQDLPISSAGSRLIGCELRLPDKTTIFGYLGNLSLTDSDRNQHFLTFSVFVGGTIEHLARYHDFDFAKRGPTWLASKLGKNVDDVFPISYDISAVARGAPEAIRGSIRAEPKTKFTRGALIQLSVRR